MSNLSDFLGGGKPKRITRYTTGTGTYVPTADMARCMVRIQAGGGGGWNAASASGGGGGAMVEVWVRISIAGWAYVIGAGGATGVDGTASSLGPYTAKAGLGSTAGAAYPGMGGVLGNMGGIVDADSVSVTASNSLPGVAGGAGGYGTGAFHGAMAGFPLAINQALSTGAFPTSYYVGNGQGVGSGGNSFFGKGGAPGASAGATEYGAGGGYQGAGAGGCIEIWDFGV